MKTAKEYRKIALNSLKNNWGMSIIIMLLIAIASSALSATGLGSIIIFVVSGAVTIGLLNYFEKLIKNDNPNYESVLENFTVNFSTKFLTYFLRELFVFLWCLLLIVPGVIKFYSYALSLYIVKKQPNLSATDAIKLSTKIMNGKKFDLFYLHFTFFGWFLLCVLTFGIGFIFLSPYFKTAVTAFYIDAYDSYVGLGDNIEIQTHENNNNQTQQEQTTEEIIIDE